MSHEDSTRSGLQTIAVHGGEGPDPVTGASAPNIVMSTTFVADPATSFSIESAADDMPFVYTRWGNPTVDQLEKKLALMEGAEACVSFASGMAAIAALLFDQLKPGDHLVMSDVTYAGASELANDLVSDVGIRVTRVNMSDLEEVQAAVTSETRLVFIETPCNPIVRLTDIAGVAAICRANNALLAVDSTFATPVATRPLSLGADFVVHSLTKYLGGHGDALGGAVLGSASAIADLRRRLLIHAGGVLSPFNAWLIMRGLATLPLRMQAHGENAMQVARFLESHPAVTRVIYPGLASHPQHGLAVRQMSNYSGMLTFQVADGPATARQLYERLQVIHYAVSLGHHRSLVFYMNTADLLESSFLLDRAQEEAYRRFAGDGFFRFSTGLEDAADICADLDRGLAGLSAG